MPNSIATCALSARSDIDGELLLGRLRAGPLPLVLPSVGGRKNALLDAHPYLPHLSLDILMGRSFTTLARLVSEFMFCSLGSAVAPSHCQYLLPSLPPSNIRLSQDSPFLCTWASSGAIVVVCKYCFVA